MQGLGQGKPGFSRYFGTKNAPKRRSVGLTPCAGPILGHGRVPPASAVAAQGQITEK